MDEVSKKRYSAERRDGFLVIVRRLQKELNELIKMSAGKVKQKVVDDLRDELETYRQMAEAENDFVTGKTQRKVARFILSEDKFTWMPNPEYKREDL